MGWSSLKSQQWNIPLISLDVPWMSALKPYQKYLHGWCEISQPRWSPGDSAHDHLPHLCGCAAPSSNDAGVAGPWFQRGARFENRAKQPEIMWSIIVFCIFQVYIYIIYIYNIYIYIVIYIIQYATFFNKSQNCMFIELRTSTNWQNRRGFRLCKLSKDAQQKGKNMVIGTRDIPSGTRLHNYGKVHNF